MLSCRKMPAHADANAENRHPDDERARVMRRWLTLGQPFFLASQMHESWIKTENRQRMIPLLLAMIQETALPTPIPLTVTEIVDHMVQADNARMAAFSGYTGMRRYNFENKKVKKHAEVTVRVVCDRTGAKTFEVVAESGSGFVRSHIIRRMIDAEREASDKAEHEQTRIIPQNYDFRLLGTDEMEGRPSYVLEISPKTKNQFMIRGRIWVDAVDFAITRLE